MKFFLPFLLNLLVPVAALPQAQAFRNFIIAANSPTNPRSPKEAFIALGGEERFASASWESGFVITLDLKKIQEGYLFNFDFANHDLYLRSPKEQQDIVVDKKGLHSFSLLIEKDTLTFVRSRAIDPSGKTFFQFIAGDPRGKAVLLLQKEVREIPINKNDYLRNFNGDYTPHFRNTMTWHVLDARLGLHSFKHLGKKELLSLYPEQMADIQGIFSRSKHLDKNMLRQIFDHLNKP